MRQTGLMAERKVTDTRGKIKYMMLNVPRCTSTADFHDLLDEADRALERAGRVAKGMQL